MTQEPYEPLESTADAYDWPTADEAAEWQVYDSKIKGVRPVTPDEMFDPPAKAEATQPYSAADDWVERRGGWQGTRPMDPREGMDSMLAHMDYLAEHEAPTQQASVPRTSPTPAEHASSAPVVPQPAAMQAAKLAQ